MVPGDNDDGQPRVHGEIITKENGKRRTENGAPDKRATGEGAGRAWKVCPAGLTRRFTKNHEGTRRKKDCQNGKPPITQIRAD